MLPTDETFLWEYLPETQKPIVLYGMGNGADRLRAACATYGVTISGVFASDDFVRGHEYAGFPVRTYEQTKHEFPNCIVLVAFGTHRPEVIANILRIAEDQELYLPDIEVVSGAPFVRETYERYHDRYVRTYDLLADDASRRTLDGLLRYRITGDISHLIPLFPQTDAGTTERRLSASKYENVVDGGAYNGDSALQYLAETGGCASLTAFEPDRKTFRKLEAALAGVSAATAVHAALGASDGTVSFAACAGRQSHVGGGQTVPQRAIDTAAPDATYIKLDVEGREIAALEGARNVIRNNRPKMCVSAYHRHADLFAIPEYVLGLCPDYRVSLVAARNLPAWDTCFLFA